MAKTKPQDVPPALDQRGEPDPAGSLPAGADQSLEDTEPLESGPEMYKTFRDKQDGCIKVVLKPGMNGGLHA